MSNRGNPQQLRPCIAMVPRETSMRVEQLVSRVGRREAMRLLGVSAATLDAARDEGRMQRATLERLHEALAAAEASAS